jgi:hypothetical protein
MFTVFSTPKPFSGRIGAIQRNAIRSWQLLHPDVQVVLFGDEPGAAEVCQELGVLHVNEVKRNRHGTKYLAPIYDRAQEIARHDLLCHVNCDIVLMSDFRRALESITKMEHRFLMAGRRWDVDIQDSLDFEHPGWEDNLRKLALQTNRQRPPQWIDYFVFRKGLYYQKIPAFVIGRPGWDVWLLWHALSVGAPVVDASEVIYAVHQNHDYEYHPDGAKGVWEGEEAQENYQLLENNRKLRTLEDATLVLGTKGLRRSRRGWLIRARRYLAKWVYQVWFFLLDVSRPLRHRIGLRQRTRT